MTELDSAPSVELPATMFRTSDFDMEDDQDLETVEFVPYVEDEDGVW